MTTFPSDIPDEAVEVKYDKGGLLPSGPVRVPMWRKHGLVSFDGPDGPWQRIIPMGEMQEWAHGND